MVRGDHGSLDLRGLDKIHAAQNDAAFRWLSAQIRRGRRRHGFAVIQVFRNYGVLLMSAHA